jgi:hypothetical protein
MGLLAAYWDLTWDLPKKLCTMHQKIEVDLLRQSQDQRTEVAALSVLGLTTVRSWMATQRLPWLDHPRLPYAFSIT